MDSILKVLLLSLTAMILAVSCSDFSDVRDPDSREDIAEWYQGVSSMETLSSEEASSGASSSVEVSSSITAMSANASSIGLSSIEVSSSIAASSAIGASSASVSSMGQSSAVVSSSAEASSGVQSSVAASSSAMGISSSSSATSSSSIFITSNTQVCTYSASGSSSGSTGTLACLSVDQKTYKTVVIGNQTWMAENLAWLPSVNPPTSYDNNEGRYYVYGYSGTDVGVAKNWTETGGANSYSTYGVLYNYPAATRACPSGWHLPSDTEWTILEDYLGGKTVAGNLLKANSSLWIPNNGSNSSQFSALPGGFYALGNFFSVGDFAEWWTSTPTTSPNAWNRFVKSYEASVSRQANERYAGFSVRCLKDSN